MLSPALKTLGRATAERSHALLSGYARLVFSGGTRVGLVLLLATFERPTTAVLGLLAVLVSYGVATAASYAREAVVSGYYGYNALLVALALAESQPLSLRIALLVSGGAALATLLAAVLGDILYRFGLPLLALPFVVVTSLLWHTTLAPGALPFWLEPHAPVLAHASLGETVLRALGAIVFRPTVLGGALVLVAVALHSRITAASLLVGALIGAELAQELAAREPALVVPAAYNAALTFAALSASFYVPSRAALWVAVASSALTAWLTAAFMLPFAPLALPVLAWPFVLVTLSVMRALGLRAPGHAPFLAFLPHATPEANLEYARTFAKRLALPGPPRFVLPVRGEWRVTQGVNGAHTHRGPWRHALDFELVDAEGFPFRGNGVALDDYYCFGEPVLAPGSGVVAAVHDGAPDNAPGEQDLARPWGNAIVLQHGPTLFSVLAHLRRGSITVTLGQHVVAGAAIAQCGASGRSPRPHLHFQVQASALLGAPTLEFRSLNYVVAGEPARFERLGVPAENESVRAPEVEACAFPPAEFTVIDREQRRITLRREVTLHGEHALVNVANGERLFFVPHAGGVIFTALRGKADGVLGALLQIAPHLPAAKLPRLRFEEELAPEKLLPLPLRLVYELLGVFFEPASARVRGEVIRRGDELVVESECEVRLLGHVVRRRRGRLELDGRGLANIELSAASFGAVPCVQAFRPFTPSADERASLPDYGPPACAAYR